MNSSAIYVVLCALGGAALFVLLSYLCRRPMQRFTTRAIESAAENTQAIVNNTRALDEHSALLREYIALKTAETK